MLALFSHSFAESDLFVVDLVVYSKGSQSCVMWDSSVG